MPMSDRLPAAEWTRRPGLARLVDALGEGNLRWVGGAVRDTLLGHEVKDVDAATPLTPQEVIARLRPARIRSAPTGIDHGTLTALLEDGTVEITTLRHDVSTDGRRATIRFAEEWRDDAARRDFTINALYADPVTLEIHDYFGGLEDLARRRVRFIGDARERIREDHLRILRYFRFQARFGSELDETAERACTELRETLKGLSRERVAMELFNLLALPDPAATVRRMAGLGILGVILPECGDAGLATLADTIAGEAAAGIPPDPIRRLAAMLPPEPEIAQTVASRLRLSNAQRKRLACVAARDPADGENPRALAYREGLECAVDRLILSRFAIAPLKGWSVPTFPLKGGEIVARGVKAGPDVARILRGVEQRWIAEGFPEPARVEALLDEALGKTG